MKNISTQAVMASLIAATPVFAQSSEPVTLGDKKVGTVSILGADDPKRDFCLQNSNRRLHFKKDEKGSLVILMCRHATEATIKPEDSCAYAQHVKSLFQTHEHNPNTDPDVYKRTMDDIKVVEKELCSDVIKFQPYAAGMRATLILRQP